MNSYLYRCGVQRSYRHSIFCSLELTIERMSRLTYVDFIFCFTLRERCGVLMLSSFMISQGIASHASEVQTAFQGFSGEFAQNPINEIYCNLCSCMFSFHNVFLLKVVEKRSNANMHSAYLNC